MNGKVIAVYIIIIVAWGSAFPGIKAALQSYSPEHLALLRLLIGSIALIIFAAVKKIRLPDLIDIPVILLLGFLGFTVYHTSLSYGEQMVSAGIASLLVSTAPIFSAILAAVFLKEKFTMIGWIGSLISFSGVALISFGAGHTQTAYFMGVLFIITAALGESFYFVFQAKFLKKYGFIAFTVYTIIAGTLFMLPFLPGLGKEVLSASAGSTLSVIYLGLIPTVIPYLALAYITSKVGATEATSSLYLTPAAALLIAWFMLGEIPSILSLAGGLITLIGVGVIQRKSPAQKQAFPILSNAPGNRSKMR
ncbi:DMT family transporter [Neobacillus kokaensis]|uniref:Transporter YdfC n=1 Tax=Neobacillus kokaensis TaxID=2759023 RepID=A0ABQ3MY49_9BACI|nr:DMT family transporter [Neobacillus kokaensis]GHH97598.1 putative transporter YdfC [Neobacillus kokaensis]